MADYNLDLLGYSNAEIEAIKEVLLEYYSQDQVIEFINNGDFVLYENCHTLEDVVRYTELQYGHSNTTIQEIDANNIWLDTKFGIIIMPN